MTKKLYELTPGTKLRLYTEEGDKEAIFHNLDGMYSLCTVVDDRPYDERIFHLSAMTPMMELEPGVWTIAAEKQ